MGKDITCTIEKELAVLSTNDHGYTKELKNYVSWNGAEAKLDIRQWWPGREKSGKGVTLTEEEGRNLRDALIAFFAGKERSQ